MSADRREFLRQLAALPLIGGSVGLIGRPTSVAEPVTPLLQERYIAWLANEHARAVAEFDRRIYHVDHNVWRDVRARMPMFWFPSGHDDIERSVLDELPSSRAALVLAAVGGGRRGLI